VIRAVSSPIESSWFSFSCAGGLAGLFCLLGLLALSPEPLDCRGTGLLTTLDSLMNSLSRGCMFTDFVSYTFDSNMLLRCESSKK
jgi:hypothetical protein